MIAESIIAAAKDIGGFKMPVVVRLQGTNAEKGLKLVCWLKEYEVDQADRMNRLRNPDWKTWSSKLTLRKLLNSSLNTLQSLNDQCSTALEQLCFNPDPQVCCEKTT